MKRRVSLRWRILRLLAPGAVLGLTACGALGGGHPAAGGGHVPAVDASALLAAVEQSASVPLSGTLVAQLALGLPQQTAEQLRTPMDGTHTLRVWYGGPTQQRVALLGPRSEIDIFYDGIQAWRWDSEAGVATQSLPGSLLPDTLASLVDAPLQFAAFTPGQLTRRVLQAVDADTDVRVRQGPRVADRATYELLLTPSDASTRVAAVHIEVDTAHKVALGVQIYAAGLSRPVIDVGFTSVTFKAPASDYFTFTPPPGTSVRTAVRTPAPVANGRSSTLGGFALAPVAPIRVYTVGSRWSAIAEYPQGTSRLAIAPDAVAPVRADAPPVPGATQGGRQDPAADSQAGSAAGVGRGPAAASGKTPAARSSASNAAQHPGQNSGQNPAQNSGQNPGQDSGQKAGQNPGQGSAHHPIGAGGGTLPSSARSSAPSGGQSGVSGNWGSGRLLISPLLCALQVEDGTVFVGPVDPDALYDAARGR